MYKKILIIGQPFTKQSGGGITLSNLFEGWDKDKLAVAATGHELGNVDFSICDNYYCLGEKEHRWIFPLNYLQRKFSSGKIDQSSSIICNKISDSHRTKTSDLRNFAVNSLLFPSLQYLGMSHCLSKIEISEEFMDWFDKQCPDVVYTQLSSLELIKFVFELVKVREVKLIIHIMDDWPTTIVRPGLFSNYWKRVIDKELRRLLDKSTALMSICKAMSDEYRERYGKNFIPFHNPIDLSVWKGQSRNDWKVGKIFRILYAGRLGKITLKSLVDICEAMTDINVERTEIIFEILTPDSFKHDLKVLKKYKGVEVRPYIQHYEMPAKLKSMDLLIIPLDFNKENLRFVRYSMPTKTSEYMASGTPILVYAHKDTALVKYAKEGGWGYVVDEEDKALLKKGLIDLITDIDLRREIGEKAIKVAFKNHNADVIRNEFQNVIIQSAQTK
jgi:glycosyltransferase involved in cell wall biosynthesis